MKSSSDKYLCASTIKKIISCIIFYEPFLPISERKSMLSLINIFYQTRNNSMSSLQEQILVVKRSILFPDENAWHGINNTNIESIVATITNNQEYIERAGAETNQLYKQIIPYMIFTFGDRYFVMQRKATASEQRLAGKLSLGIGGHMNQEDMHGKTIFDWAQREFEEEVSYTGNLKITTLGVLNDDTNDVGKVHLGLVLLLKGDNDQIAIKSEHKSGVLLTKQECLDKFDQFEGWSQHILQILS